MPLTLNKWVKREGATTAEVQRVPEQERKVTVALDGASPLDYGVVKE